MAIDGGEPGFSIMIDSASPSTISFWRRDWNWYVQQQSWTRPFSEQDRAWTQRLLVSNSPVSALGPPSANAGDIADQKVENLVVTQTGSSLTRALGTPASASAISVPGNVPRGTLLDRLA
jgi:hypothetical protein